MTITITTETGAGIAGANTFVSLVDFKTHADQRGRIYTAVYVDEAVKAALIKMGDYLNSLPWRGRKTAQANPMAWPRCDDQIYAVAGFENITTSVGVVDRDGFLIGTDTVPPAVVNAQCEGAWLILTGKDMEPALDRGGALKREKIDSLEWEFFPGASPTTEFKAVSNRLRGLLKSSFSTEVVRS